MRPFQCANMSMSLDKLSRCTVCKVREFLEALAIDFERLAPRRFSIAPDNVKYAVLSRIHCGDGSPLPIS